MTLHNADCLEVLRQMPDKSVDLIVTDPPYLFDGTVGGGAYGVKNKKYHSTYTAFCSDSRVDKNKARQRANIGEINAVGFNPEVLDECFRVMKKPNIYIWCSKAQLRLLLDYFCDRDCHIDLITWHKTNPIPTCNGTYLNDTEYCLFARKGAKVYGTYATKRKYYVSKANVEDKKLYKHPTIKPLPIISNLIVNSSLEGQTVLDPFMGSGTTGVACKNLNREFIGIEINKEFFDIAERRILND